MEVVAWLRLLGSALIALAVFGPLRRTLLRDLARAGGLYRYGALAVVALSLGAHTMHIHRATYPFMPWTMYSQAPDPTLVFDMALEYEGVREAYPWNRIRGFIPGRSVPMQLQVEATRWRIVGAEARPGLEASLAHLGHLAVLADPAGRIPDALVLRFCPYPHGGLPSVRDLECRDDLVLRRRSE